MKKRHSLLTLLFCFALITSIIIVVAATGAMGTDETKHFCRTETQVSNFTKKDYDDCFDSSESQHTDANNQTNTFFQGRDTDIELYKEGDPRRRNGLTHA